MQAWNGWYHVNGNTYGTWLRGDPRGWRTRWHRQHVAGDYKNRPAQGTFEETYAMSKRLLKKSPVYLDEAQRKIAGQALVEKLIEMGVEPLACSQDASHYHILAKFPDNQVRQAVGRAKKHASHVLRGHGLEGTVWARKCRALPVRDRQHQLNAFHYIESHGNKGAWAWTFREGLYWVGERANAKKPP